MTKENDAQIQIKPVVEEVDPRAVRYSKVTNLKEMFGSKYKVTWDDTKRVEHDYLELLDNDRIERIWLYEIKGVLGFIYPTGFNGDLAICSDSWAVLNDVVKHCEGEVKQGFCAWDGRSAEGTVRFPVKHAQYVLEKIHAHLKK